MILARISKAIREQNWFAVVLEFVIVVAGVLLAFQISQFAADHAARAQARDAMARVEAEAREMIMVRQRVRDSFEAHLDDLIAALLHVMGHQDGPLTPEQCWAVAHSGTIPLPPDSVPTMAEVTTSGILAAIDNEALRLATMRFASKRDSVREWVRRYVYQTDDLTRLFPDLVWLDLVESDEDDGWDRRAVCDLEAMQGSRAFQAHLNRNHVVTRGTRTFVYDFLDGAFTELHTAIDAELDLTHAAGEEAAQ